MPKIILKEITAHLTSYMFLYKRRWIQGSLIIFTLQETNEFQFIWQKLYSRERPIAYSTGESWIRGIEIVLAHFQRLFGRSNRDAFLENEGKIHEGGYVKEFFSLTCRLASRNFIID